MYFKFFLGLCETGENIEPEETRGNDLEQEKVKLRQRDKGQLTRLNKKRPKSEGYQIFENIVRLVSSCLVNKVVKRL